MTFFAVRFAGPAICRRTSPPLTRSGFADSVRISSAGPDGCCAVMEVVSDRQTAMSPMAAERVMVASNASLGPGENRAEL